MYSPLSAKSILDLDDDDVSLPVIKKLIEKIEEQETLVLEGVETLPRKVPASDKHYAYAIKHYIMGNAALVCRVVHVNGKM